MPHYEYEYAGMSDDQIKAAQEAAEEKGLKPVIRFRVPKDEVFKREDLVKGPMSFEALVQLGATLSSKSATDAVTQPTLPLSLTTT